MADRHNKQSVIVLFFKNETLLLLFYSDLVF